MPIVTNATFDKIKEGMSIVFVGTNLDLGSSFVPSCIFSGVYGTSAVLVNSTALRCTFQYGLPHSLAPVAPILWYDNDAAHISHWAIVNRLLHNPFTNITSKAVTCSFMGGCVFNITQWGLASDLRNETKTQIKVCDEICEFNKDLSSPKYAACILPKVPTDYHFENYRPPYNVTDDTNWDGKCFKMQMGRRKQAIKGQVFGSKKDCDKVLGDNREFELKKADYFKDQQVKHFFNEIMEAGDSERLLDGERDRNDDAKSENERKE